MHKIQILGLIAILASGTLIPAMAEKTYDEWDEQRRILEDEFMQKKDNIDKMFQEEYDQLDRYYENRKIEIYNKIESDSSITDSERDEMFNELFTDFEEKRRELDNQMEMQYEELERMFQEEMNRFGEDINVEQNDYYQDFDDGTYSEKYYDEPYKNDPEWESIKSLAEKIMESVPMDKIQRLWESGDVDSLINLIVSETDLTEEEAKQVILFFQKYEDRDYREHNADAYLEPEIHYEAEQTYQEGNNIQIQILEKRISELEEENMQLRSYIIELEDKIKDINTVLMEQVKFIYEWASSQ